MAASSGSKMKLGMMKRKIKKKKVQTATGDRKWIKRMFFFVVARSPPATLRVRASSVRVLRERGGFESLEILLRHRAFFCGVESFDRAWKITLPASHERGASPSISPRPHTSIDRSRFFAFSLSLFLFSFFFRRINGNDGCVYFPFVHRRVSSDFHDSRRIASRESAAWFPFLSFFPSF